MAIKKMIKVPDRDPFIGANLNANFVDIDDNFEYLDKKIAGTPAIYEITPVENVNGTPVFTPDDPDRGRRRNSVQEMADGLTAIHLALEMPEGKYFPSGLFGVAAVPTNIISEFIFAGAITLSAGGATSYPVTAYVRPKGVGYEGQIFIHNPWGSVSSNFSSVTGTLFMIAK